MENKKWFNNNKIKIPHNFNRNKNLNLIKQMLMDLQKYNLRNQSIRNQINSNTNNNKRKENTTLVQFLQMIKIFAKHRIQLMIL